MREIPEGFIIPDFGDTPASTTSKSTASTSDSSASGYSGPRKMVFISSKGNLDMAYPALIMANAAAGEGIETHIFFTFWGLDVVNKKTMDKLQFTMVGNTAMHMPEMGYLKPGMEHYSFPQWVGRLPGMTPMGTKMMKKQLDDLEIPPVREMLDLLEAAGVHMWACKLTFDMMKLLEADMHDGVEGVIDATEFIELSEGAQIIFV